MALGLLLVSPVIVFFSIIFFFPQVNEIYHDESLGVHINVVLVRMIMLGYAKVSKPLNQFSAFIFFVIIVHVNHMNCCGNRSLLNSRFQRTAFPAWHVLNVLVPSLLRLIMGVPLWHGCRPGAACPGLQPQFLPSWVVRELNQFCKSNCFGWPTQRAGAPPSSSLPV